MTAAITSEIVGSSAHAAPFVGFAPAAAPSLALGVIGNCAFSALVDAHARIVWCCLPRFDGDPVFNALLEPGDALVHHANTFHFSAPNTSEQARLGLLMVFKGAHCSVDESLRARYAMAS